MRIFIFLFFSNLFVINSYGQSTTGQITSRSRIELENSNSWAIGVGFSNFIMHGDLRSIGTGELGNFWNFGAYAYVDKMFNPLLGLELKVNYSNLSGGAQYFSDIYDILYLNQTKITNHLFFKGIAYGAELNLILSFSNLYLANTTKWHVTGYFGAGYHQYNSALYERLPNGTNTLLIDFGNNLTRNSVNVASSIYLSAQLGLKYRINKRIDLEFRPSWYFNYEDHLDATISEKQNWETFFVTNIGIVVKLGKRKQFSIWENKNRGENQFKIVDSDNDGVMDELDIEPNTPAQVLVYGNGKAIDSDKDGLPDHKDKCPLEYGPISNEGCPLNIDSDGDGILDKKDVCPNTKGTKKNKGCPELKVKKPEKVTQQIALLATSIYFGTNSDVIKNISFGNIDKIVALMKKAPTVKFVIEGHTDNSNSDKYNLYLSKRRARSVKIYMVKLGISSDRLKSIGYGESRPKFSNGNGGGRQLNRRVEIKPVDSFE